MTDKHQEAWIKNAIEYIRVIDVRPGDTIVLKWTYLELGDGQGPWIPGTEEINQVLKTFEKLYPDHKVIVIGPWIDVELVRV